MLDQEIANQDRRRAALHEAAHAVLAHRFGGKARAYIWPSPSGGSFEEKAWSGSCQLWAPPGWFKPGASAPGVIEAPSEALALIGLAGVTAEIYDEHRDQEAAFWELQSLLEVEELSATDKALVGEQVSSELLEQVIAHVSMCWLEIERHAADLERRPESVRPRHLE